MEKRISKILTLAKELSLEIDELLNAQSIYEEEIKEIEYFMIDIAHILSGVNLNSREIMQIGIEANKKLSRRKELQKTLKFIDGLSEPLENAKSSLKEVSVEGENFTNRKRNYSFLTNEGFDLLKKIHNYENRTVLNLGFNNLNCKNREEKKQKKQNRTLSRKDIEVHEGIKTNIEVSCFEQTKVNIDCHMELKKEIFSLISSNGEKISFSSFKDLFKFISDRKNLNVVYLDANCSVRINSIYKSQAKDASLKKDKHRIMLLRSIAQKPVV